MSSILNSLLIPYSPLDSILVPNELVECILPYAIPLSSEYQHPALVGSLIYRDTKIPIVNIASLNKGYQNPLPKNSLGKYRIVMLSSIAEESFCDSYAVITSSRPSLLKVTADMLTEVHSSPSPYFYNKVEIDLESRKQKVYIPHLERIEEELFSIKIDNKIEDV
ncbi:MAG: hypothetical protein KGV56_01080 [Gammaproteobacteria bacterium]|nr:hypothetical protein [Gammaproteobacteria bacterium]